MDSAAASSSSAPGPAKRNRPILSCVQCRQAKSKCDRQSPCALCIRKGRAEQCTYPLPVSRKKAAVSLQKRLRNLESMVKNVMANNESLPETATGLDASGKSSSDAPSVNFESTPCGLTTSQTHTVSQGFTPASQVILNGNESSYIGNIHWKTLLTNVGSLRRSRNHG
jgi:hypothetical protein